MVRFLHTADWQIGKPYHRVSDGQKRFRLQQERIAAIGRIREAAARHGVAFVLVAGDLFDSTTVAAAAVVEVLEAIGELAVPVLVIPGNHDHGAPGSLWHRADFQRQRERRAPNLRLLLERQPLAMEGALLLPCPLLRNQDSTDPTAWIAQLDPGDLPADLPRIVLAHGGIQGFAGRDYGGDEEAQAGALNRIDLAALEGWGADYIALGDWHNGQQVGEKAWYCGTPEPDRFDQGEDNQRGQVLLVEAERDRPPRVEGVPTGRIGWHNLRFHFQGDDDLARFERLVEERIGDRVARDLLRLEVSGSLSLAGHARWQQRLEDLRHQLLRLRLKGRCDPAPGPQELAALVERRADPLIAAVAGRLQQQLVVAEGPTMADSASADGAPVDPVAGEAAAIARLALCELHRLATLEGA
jgi:DNA repair exonuclease SbcCD nuclease subunit